MSGRGHVAAQSENLTGKRQAGRSPAKAAFGEEMTALEEFWLHAVHCPTCEPFPPSFDPTFKLCAIGRRLFFVIPMAERPEVDVCEKN